MTEANAHNSYRRFLRVWQRQWGVSPAIVAIEARPRVATSGVVWRDGVIVKKSKQLWASNPRQATTTEFQAVDSRDCLDPLRVY